MKWVVGEATHVFKAWNPSVLASTHTFVSVGDTVMSRWIRRLAYALGTLVVLIMLLSGFVYVKSSSMMSKKYSPPSEPLSVVRDSATISRGKHFVTAIGKCVNCHTESLGGKVFIDDPVLGRVTATNLTMGKGGVGNKYTDAQLAVAIRHGIKFDSTTALVMPSNDYQDFTDEDVDAIVAYIRSLPPVDNTLPKTELRFVGRALGAFGQLPFFVAELVPIDRPHAPRMVSDTSVAYGSYLTHVGGCTGCHNASLSGGKMMGTPADFPAASNLTPTGLKHYSDTDLEKVLRTGVRPGGSKLNDEMPWRNTAQMTAEEMTATIKYLRSVPAKDFGAR